MIEEWRAIKGCPGFLVSNRGRVKRTDDRLITIKSSGCIKRCSLTVKGKKQTFRVENLVRSAFGFRCERGCLPNPFIHPEDQKPCDTAIECWRCGLNPDVEYERKLDIRQHGLTKDEDGLLRYHVRAEV